MAVLASGLEETCSHQWPLSVLCSQVPGSGRRLTFLSPAPAAPVAVSFPGLTLGWRWWEGAALVHTLCCSGRWKPACS